MKHSFQLSIETPCHETWENFKPTTTGGFCSSCQKNVIDFTKMSESELVAFFRDRSSQNLCGRFRDDQLKKDYHIEDWFPAWTMKDNQVLYEIPVEAIRSTSNSKKIRLPLIQNMKAVRNMAFAVLTLFFVEEGMGQNRLISGQVIDADTGEPFPGVSIKIKGTTRGTISDSIGKYQISADEKDTLIFGSIGYKNIEKQASATQDLQKMEMDTQLLGEVIVAGYSSITKGKMGTGGVSFRTTNDDLSENTTKCASTIEIWGNAVQNEEAIIIPKLSTHPDSSIISYDKTKDERWFRQNGFQEITSVQVYDQSGRIFTENYTKISDGEIKIDVKHIPTGVYIVKVIFSNERSITKQEISNTRLLIER